MLSHSTVGDMRSGPGQLDHPVWATPQGDGLKPATVGDRAQACTVAYALLYVVWCLQYNTILLYRIDPLNVIL